MTDGKFRKIRPWLVGAGIVWGLALTLIAALSDPTPENRTLAASIWAAGLYTIFLRLTRPAWLPLLAKRPVPGAILFGIFNAAVIETEFLIFEKLFGAAGVAAHPNLLVDLAITMPWYAGMLILFVLVQQRHRFSAATVLLLGGLYEIGGDGVAGQIGELFAGNFQLFSLEYWAMLGLMFFWAFIPVYSSMLLPPAWVLAAGPPAPSKPVLPRPLAALLPLAWVPPFIVYLGILLLILSAFG